MSCNEVENESQMQWSHKWIANKSYISHQWVVNKSYNSPIEWLTSCGNKYYISNYVIKYNNEVLSKLPNEKQSHFTLQVATTIRLENLSTKIEGFSPITNVKCLMQLRNQLFFCSCKTPHFLLVEEEVGKSRAGLLNNPLVRLHAFNALS